MPTFPLASPTPLAGGELPVRTAEDVLALLPVESRRIASAPVRDALAAALAEILLEYQRRASQGAALGDILRARGQYLAGLAADHEVYPQPGESEESIRARILKLDELVTPNDILAAVNAILAPFSDVQAKYFESELDQWFVGDDTVTEWDSFVFDGVEEAAPRYPDRYYPDDTAENGGHVLGTREVIGAWAFADTFGRHFILRLPELAAVDEIDPFAFDETVEDEGMWVADGSDEAGAESDGSVAMFTYETTALADELYEAIVAIVEFLKGQGMRFSAIVDPLLT